MRALQNRDRCNARGQRSGPGIQTIEEEVPDRLARRSQRMDTAARSMPGLKAYRLLREIEIVFAATRQLVYDLQRRFS
jgi:hypothetical protein